MAYDDPDDTGVATLPQPDVEFDRDLRRGGITTGITPAQSSGYQYPSRLSTGLTPTPTGLGPKPSPIDILGSRRPPPLSELQNYTFGESQASTLSKAAPEGSSSAFADAGKLFWQGMVGQGRDVLGAAEFVSRQLSGDSTVSQHLKQWGKDTEGYIQSSIDSMDPRRKDALSASMLAYVGHNVDAAGNKIPTPGEVGWGNYVLANAMSLLPTAIVAILPATLAGKLAVKGLSTLGVATKATETATGLTKAGNIARLGAESATSGGIFGAEAAGQMFNYISDEIAKTPDAEMMKSAPYAELRKQGMSEDDAKAAIRDSSAPYVLGMGTLGAVTGVSLMSLLGGKLATKGVGRLAQGAIGAGEGALMTGGQAGPTTAAQQAFQQSIGTRQGYDYGAILADTVSQGGMGAMLGGAAGVFHGRKRAPDGVDPANSLALEAAGPPVPPNHPEFVGPREAQGPPTEPAGPPGPPMGPPTAPVPAVDPAGQGLLPGMADQNEMFTGREMGQGQAPVEPAITGVQPGMPETAQQGQLFDPGTQVTAPQPVQAEMFPRATPEPVPPVAAAPTEMPPVAAAAAVTTSKAAAAPPVAAEAAVAKSKAKTAPTQAKPESAAGMAKDKLLAELRETEGVNQDLINDPKVTRSALVKEHNRLYSSTEAPEVTTVVNGSVQGGHTEPVPTPVRSEGRQAPKSDTAPPAKGTSLPPKPAGETVIQPKAENPSAVRPEGGTARSSGEQPAQATTEKPGESKAKITLEVEKPTTVKGADGAAAIVVSKEAGAAKRAARKAKLEGIIPDKTGPKAHVEAPTTGTRAETPNERANRIATEDDAREMRRTAAVDQVWATLQAGIRAATNLKKGDQVVGFAPATHRVMQDLRERVYKADGTDEGTAKAVHEWAQAHSGQIPQTKTSWYALGDAIHKRLSNGRSFPEREAFASEAAAMVEAQPRDVESETQQRRSEKEEATTTREQDDARAEALVAGGEAPATSTGLTATLEGAGDAKIAKGTSAEVRGRQLIEKALDPNDPMTALQADRDYGAQNQGRGRKRKAGTEELAAIARGMLEKAKDVKKEQALLIQMIENEKDTKSSPHTKETRTKALEAELANYGKERVAELERFLKELTDPTAAAADDAQRLADRARLGNELKADAARRAIPEDTIPDTRAAPDGISPRSSRYSRVANDPRLSAGYEHAVRTAQAQGITPTTHELLRTVLQDALLGNEMRPFRRLAQILLKRAPDIPVMSAEDALAAGRIDRETYNRLHTRTFGAFDPVSNTIISNIDNERAYSTHVETFLHEVMHSITFNYLENLRRHDPRNQDFMLLNAIKSELRDHAVALEKTMDTAEIQRIFGAIKDVHELHTVLMTSPTAQAFAASVRASPEFRAKLAQYGMPARPGASIWRSFTDWVRKAVGLGPTLSASEQTFLDHILRPLSDIAERAHDYNKKMLPEDPTVRRFAEPLYDGINSGFRERSKALLDHADTSGWKGAARRALLTTAPFDRLRDRYKHLAQDGERNYIDEVRTAIERSRVAGGEFINKFRDETQRIVRALKGKDELAELMNDAGYARAALGDVAPDANKHLTEPDEQARLTELQTRFRALPKADQALYNETRDLLAKRYAREREAHANGLVNRFMPEATPEEKAHMREVMSSEEKLDAFLADPNNAEIGVERRVVARGMAELHRMGFVQGDYFPMRRYGDWVVQYGEEGTPSHGVQFFESRNKAEAFRKDMLQRGEDVQSVRERDSIVQQRALSPSPAIEAMMQKVRANPELKEHAGELHDMISRLQLQYASGAERSRSKRRRVAGASKDIARAIEGDLAAAGLRVGRMEHGGERDAAMLRLKYHNDVLSRANHAGADTLDQVRHEMSRRFGIGDDAAYGGASALASKLTSFGYGQALMSFSRLATETAEMHLRMGSFIGARHGAGRASLELARAMKDISPKLLAQGASNTAKAFLGKPLSAANYDLATMAKDRLLASGHNRADVEAFFKHFHETGLFDQTQAMALRELARPSNMGKAWNWFIDVSSAMSHAADETNRIAGAWAAFRAERTGGKPASVADALKFAEDTLRKAPSFAPENRPRIATDKGPLGKFAAPLMQFKLYGLNEHWVLANLARDIISRSTDPTVRKEAILAFTGTVMAHSLMAGALTWYADPARYIGGLYDVITGQKPQDRTLTARKWLADTIGPTAGELFGRGLPRGLGIDVSHRLGVENMLNIPELNGWTKKDLTMFAGQLALGAAGENAEGVITGFFKAVGGDIYGGVKDMVPRIVRDPLKAAGLATKGVEDSRGKQVLAPEKLSTADIIAQAVGFTPASVAEARAGRQAVLQARDRLHDERTKLTTRWMEADPEDRPAVMAEIRQWNADPSNTASRITMQQLLQTMHQRKKDERKEGAFGLRLPKKGAQQLIDAGSFANI